MITLMAVLAVGLVYILVKAPLWKDQEEANAQHHVQDGDEDDESSAELDKNSFFEYVNQGNEHLQHHRLEQALACFQVAAKIRENEPVVHFKIGRIYLQREDYKHAITAFNNVLTLQPNHIEAYFELARVYHILHQDSEALHAIEKALEFNPSHEESLKLQVKILEQQKNYAAMLPILHLLMSLSKYGHHRKYRAQYADTLSQIGKHEEAVTEYLTLCEQDSINKALYESKIANIYFETEQYAKAIEFYRRIVYANDSLGNDADIKTKMAAALCNEGVRHFDELNDNQSAIKYYLEALKYDTKNPDIYYNLGKAYLKTGQLENGRKNLLQAFEMSPKDACCAYELAMLEDQQGDIDAAIKHYKAVLTLEPQHSMASYGLGALYGVQGNLDKCVEYLTRSIQSNPNFEDAIYNLGVALEKQNQPNKAIQMYKKVLTINATHEQARSNLMHLQHSH